MWAAKYSLSLPRARASRDITVPGRICAIDALPAEFREILALRHQEGLSYKEIAEIAQIPPGTVMSRLARARGKLKEYLAAHIGKGR